MPRRTESAYQRVGRELRTKIVDGVYADGLRLPTEAELAEDYGVSRQTIRRAFQDLVAEELVFRVPGRGTFAAPARDGYVRPVGSIDDLMGLSDDTGLQVLDPLARRVDLVSAGRLGLEADAVFRLRFVRTHDGAPFCVTTVFLPPDLGRKLARDDRFTTRGATTTLTVIGVLDRKLGAPIAEAQQSIAVDLADPEAAAALACPVGHPLLRIDRLYRDAHGTAVELAVSHFRPEQYSYRITLRRHG